MRTMCITCTCTCMYTHCIHVHVQKPNECPVVHVAHTK